MKGNDLSNEVTPRYYVMALAVFVKNEHHDEKRSWFKSMLKSQVVWTPDLAALSRLWRWSHSRGVRLELVFTDEMTGDAIFLWDSLDKGSANPFSDWHIMESAVIVSGMLPWRPDIHGVVDLPMRAAIYGGKGVTLDQLP